MPKLKSASKSTVCGPNQLIGVGAPYFYMEDEFGTKICQVYGQLLPAENRIPAGNSWPVCLKKLVLNSSSIWKYGAPTPISWFGPKTADLEADFNFGHYATSLYFVFFKCVLPKKWQLLWSDEDWSANATAAANCVFVIFQILEPSSAQTVGRILTRFFLQNGFLPSTCGSIFIPFYLAVSEVPGGVWRNWSIL